MFVLIEKENNGRNERNARGSAAGGRECEKQFMLSIIVFSAWVNCKNHSIDVAVVVAAAAAAAAVTFLSFVFLLSVFFWIILLVVV